MEITEVRVKLMDDPDDRLQAFCSITIDDSFVVRDLKIIDGSSGPFVAMPSRKLTSHCRKCRSKNHLRANFCNNCGTKQQHEPATRDHSGRVKLYADIAHPINSECREEIQRRVIEEFHNELELSGDPNYVTRYDDGYDHHDVVDEIDVATDDQSSGKTADSSEADVDSATNEQSSSKPVTRIETEQIPSGPHQPPGAGKQSDSVGDGSNEKSRRNDSDSNAFGAGIFE